MLAGSAVVRWEKKGKENILRIQSEIISAQILAKLPGGSGGKESRPKV